MFKFALIGAGRIGSMHAENISRLNDATLVSVYDPNKKAAKEVASLYKARSADTADEAIGANDVDCVLIASSSSTHCELIEKAVLAKKPVLCEKPLDLDIGTIDKTWDKIKNLSPKVMVGFNRRFDPGHGGLQKRVVNGEIGELEQVIISSRDPAPPPREYFVGGDTIFKDMTIHDFDMARFVLKEEVSSVFATASVLVAPWFKEIGDNDSAMVILRTKSGKLCHINNCRRAIYGYDQRVEAFGSKGMLISDNKRKDGVVSYTEALTDAKAPLEYFFVERYKESYENEVKHFVSSLKENKELSPSYFDGKQATVLASAAEQSLKEGRIVSIKND